MSIINLQYGKIGDQISVRHYGSCEDWLSDDIPAAILCLQGNSRKVIVYGIGTAIAIDELPALGIYFYGISELSVSLRAYFFESIDPPIYIRCVGQVNSEPSSYAGNIEYNCSVAGFSRIRCHVIRAWC